MRMKILLSHQSALDFWRIHRREKNRYPLYEGTLAPSEPPGKSSLANAALRDLDRPLDVAVSMKSAQRTTKQLVSHSIGYTLAPDSAFCVTENLLVSSPEFCYLQMAGKLSLHQLIQLGYELCGSYSPNVLSRQRDLPDGSRNTLYELDPLTEKQKLLQYMLSMSNAYNHKKAMTALQYVIDGSASPRETILVMLLTLPQRYGGFGLPFPDLNYHIYPAQTTSTPAEKSFRKCDLYWSDFRLAVEYDSDLHHTGAERIASDARRRNSLLSQGITLITVTNQQMKSMGDFAHLARQLAGFMNIKPRYVSGKKFEEAHRNLRKSIMQPSSTV